MSNPSMMSDEWTASRLTHLEGESAKTTFELWVLQCPRCNVPIKLDDVQFTGQANVTHKCGIVMRWNFKAVADKYPKLVTNLPYDQETLNSLFPPL